MFGLMSPMRKLEDGCVQMTIELPLDRVEELLESIRNGCFEEFDIGEAWCEIPIPQEPNYTFSSNLGIPIFERGNQTVPKSLRSEMIVMWNIGGSRDFRCYS
jgi:hypothetical protein